MILIRATLRVYTCPPALVCVVWVFERVCTSVYACVRCVCVNMCMNGVRVCKRMNMHNNNNSPVNVSLIQRESIAFSGVLFVFIILSNLAVLLSIAVSNRRKSRTNFFIMHLALAGRNHYRRKLLPSHACS